MSPTSHRRASTSGSASFPEALSRAASSSGKYRSRDRAPEGTRYGDRNPWFPYFDIDLGFKVFGPLETMANDHGVSMAAVALAWLRDRPGVTSVILGARKVDQLSENLKALDLALGPNEVAGLEEITRPPERYPQWMMSLQRGARPEAGRA